MRTMKTTMALALTLGSTTLWASSASAQAGEAAGADKRPRIQLSEDTEKPSAEAKTPAPKSTAPAAGEAEKAAAPSDSARAPAGAAPATEEAKVLPESPESEADKAPAVGLEPAEPAETPAEGSATPVDKSQPRIIDISADEIADEDMPPPEPQIRGSELPFTYHLNHIDVSGGFRVVGTRNDGLQPFLVDPVLVDVYARGGIAFALTDRIALAPHLEIGGASTSADVRGMASQLDKVHLTLGLEGRYHFIHRMFGYARVAPGLEFVSASIGEDDTGGQLVSDDKWPGSVAFQFDSALGASLRVFGSDDGRKRNPRLWIFAEGGYRASGKHKLNMAIDGDGPRRAAPIELSPLNFSGGFFSTGLMASF